MSIILNCLNYFTSWLPLVCFPNTFLCVCQYNQLMIIKAVFLGTSNTIYRPLILFSHFIYVKIFWQMSFKLEFCCVLPDMSGRMTSFCSIGTTSIIKRSHRHWISEIFPKYNPWSHQFITFNNLINFDIE